MAKFKERIRARELRREGRSIKEIARLLNVSPDSVSRWCKEVKLSKGQIRELERRWKDPNYGKRLENSLRQQKKRILKTEKLKKAGVKEISNLSKRELFLVGASLYWAEGFKKDSQVGFANSSPEMMNLFLRWLYECFGYNTNDLMLRVTVNVSHKYRIDEIQNYWSEITKIPLDNFQKPFYQNFKWKKIYENPNEYYGILRIKVRKSTDFLRKIHGYIEGLKLQSQIR